jgi:hypothetical protein
LTEACSTVAAISVPWRTSSFDSVPPPAPEPMTTTAEPSLSSHALPFIGSPVTGRARRRPEFHQLRPLGNDKVAGVLATPRGHSAKGSNVDGGACGTELKVRPARDNITYRRQAKHNGA